MSEMGRGKRVSAVRIFFGGTYLGSGEGASRDEALANIERELRDLTEGEKREQEWQEFADDEGLTVTPEGKIVTRRAAR